MIQSGGLITEAGALGLEQRFRALGDEKRLRILRLLGSGERCVCELAVELGAKQPLLSFHLKTLREAGLVVASRRGKWIYYALDANGLGELAAFLDRLSEAGAEGAAAGLSECC